ncbi:NUDIX domain-containing protein [Methylotenera sp.]|uniref:NUDIX domain-containing protein n=1 Tax=Methylotenera sp. TaxID=2051956 RepID=UPI00272EF962|nr:NUDIX hydrolase [Methylotenera sp.]MDP2072278.1 NUDIX hydrolase [Methylotenera sp.]MDP3005077.1 NUDIX hydrolase [Methylotenera sp.]
MLSSDDDLIEHCISSQTIAAGGMLTVKCDEVRLPNGNTSLREYVTHPGAVLIVPILPNGNVVLEKQFRYPLNQVFIELPAGKIDAGEEVLLTGQRELLEETGYVASHWVKLGHQHPCIGYSNEVIHIYLAHGLVAGTHQRDEDESLIVFEDSLANCLSMIQSGEITDGKTIIALFLAEKYLMLNPQLQPQLQYV